jgi:WD40 repeat protein
MPIEKTRKTARTSPIYSLAAFSRALTREAHVFLKRPDLLWQQLYNRLQWEDEPVPRMLKWELARRIAPGAPPWLRLRTPFPESAVLIRTLVGHTSAILACAISPDSSFIFSPGNDGPLRIWDAATGVERATLEGHTGWIVACAISPDSSFIVSASWDGTLGIWDAATGAGRAVLEGHTDLVLDCAISPDSSFIISTNDDEALRVWDVASGIERAVLGGDPTRFHPHVHFPHWTSSPRCALISPTPHSNLFATTARGPMSAAPARAKPAPRLCGRRPALILRTAACAPPSALGRG